MNHEIDSQDKVVINIALNSFIENGYQFTTDKKMAALNKKIAVECKEKFKKNQLQFTLNDARVIYISLALLKDELSSGMEPPFDDEQLTADYNKYSLILDRLISIFGDNLPDV